MRIMSLKVAPVARIVALGYGVLGPLMVIWSKLSGAQQFTLPLGMVAPMVSFNFNFILPMPDHIAYGLLLCVGAALSFAATGWLTGAVLILVFNFVARRTGGVEASVVTDELVQTKPA